MNTQRSTTHQLLNTQRSTTHQLLNTQRSTHSPAAEYTTQHHSPAAEYTTQHHSPAATWRRAVQQFTRRNFGRAAVWQFWWVLAMILAVLCVVAVVVFFVEFDHCLVHVEDSATANPCSLSAKDICTCISGVTDSLTT
jgi:hypothetical protein